MKWLNLEVGFRLDMQSFAPGNHDKIEGRGGTVKHMHIFFANKTTGNTWM